MKNDKSELNGSVNQQQTGQVIDDIWSTFPNVHLRVLTAEKESIEIQICDCGMSGQCRPQAWARIERHNRERLARAIAAAPSGATAAPSSAFVQAFRDTAVKCHAGYKHEGPWEECEWIECEDRRKMINELAEPVTTTTTTAARAAAEEIVKAWLWHTKEHDQARAVVSIERYILKHFPTAVIEAGGDEEFDPPATTDTGACLLCEKGFPIKDGVHYGTQALGMIPSTWCAFRTPEGEGK